MKTISLLATLALGAALLQPLPAAAGPGHDHGHDHAAPAATGPALPRFAAVSETFELVGVLDGRRLTLYLDRTADNAPVTGAQIELEIGGAPLKAVPRDEVYEVELAAKPRPGVLPLTATVTAGPEIDLLAGELDLRAGGHAHGAAHAHPWTDYAGWGAGTLLALVVLAFAGRRVAAARQRRAGAAA